MYHKFPIYDLNIINNYSYFSAFYVAPNAIKPEDYLSSGRRVPLQLSRHFNFNFATSTVQAHTIVSTASSMDSDYNDANRAFLQAFMARSSMTLEEAQPVLAAILSTHGRSSCEDTLPTY